jgi:hypothetical protein
MKTFNVLKKLKGLVSMAFAFVVCLSASAQYVDPFTGSFSNSMELMRVSSPDGPGIPVTASYKAGIEVKQSASEIGLGWSLGAGGAITRSVFGLPDDWNGVSTMSPQLKANVNH